MASCRGRAVRAFLNYKDALTEAMTILAQTPRTLFIGQNTIYDGAVDIPATLAPVPMDRRIEFPVAEDLQLGVCIGLALAGWLPVCIYPRMDFLVLALNQLVNHLDKMQEMSAGRYRPKVIVRVGIGGSNPLDPGPQHRQDHTGALKLMLANTDVVGLDSAAQIKRAYAAALQSSRSSVLVERLERMR